MDPYPRSRPDRHHVVGYFDDADGVARAVEELGAASVPADEIDVYVIDGHGERDRRVSVERRFGTTRGAVLGAVGGAALGLAAVVVAFFAQGPGDPLGITSLSGIVRVVGASAAMGIPIGAVLAMGRWRGRTTLQTSDFANGGVAVVVETDQLSDVARRVLEDAGATRVTG